MHRPGLAIRPGGAQGGEEWQQVLIAGLSPQGLPLGMAMHRKKTDGYWRRCGCY